MLRHFGEVVRECVVRMGDGRGRRFSARRAAAWTAVHGIPFTDGEILEILEGSLRAWGGRVTVLLEKGRGVGS